MTVIERAQHYTTFDLGALKRRRTISNWSNYKLPSGLWYATQDKDPVQASQPPDWEGTYDFRFQKLEGPLQYFAGDTTDPNNTTLVGIRSSEFPLFWLNFKALGVNTGVPWEALAGQNAIRWIDIWQNSDLYWGYGRNRLEKKIRLKQWPHPVVFRFAFKIPARMTYEVINDQLILRNGANGNELMRSNKPYIEDANGNYFPAHLREGNPAGGFPTIEIYIEASEVPNPIYPLWLDPTVSITNASAIDDSFLFGNNASNGDKNYGALTTLDGAVFDNQIGAYPLTSVIRYDASLIPAGNIDAHRLFAYIAFAGNGIGEFYRVVDANTWVEGSSIGAIEAGATCWNYCIYNTQNWAGGQMGCSVAGTDHDSDASPPSISESTSGYKTVSLVNSWASDWRDGNRVNNGIVFKANDAAGETVRIFSSEHATNPLYFEIDYSEIVVTFRSSIILPVLRRKIR